MSRALAALQAQGNTLVVPHKSEMPKKASAKALENKCFLKGQQDLGTPKYLAATSCGRGCCELVGNNEGNTLGLFSLKDWDIIAQGNAGDALCLMRV